MPDRMEEIYKEFKNTRAYKDCHAQDLEAALRVSFYFGRCYGVEEAAALVYKTPFSIQETIHKLDRIDQA